MKRNGTRTSQALHILVRPLLWYLDLEFARAELEIDKFRNEVLGLGFEDLYGGQAVRHFHSESGVWRLGRGDGGRGRGMVKVGVGWRRGGPK
jgi:hypothetical protein